jgi:predicted enzyme related to lactoylglutathione lyase
MSEWEHPEAGKVTWIDLTAENAEEVRSFYSEVVGWKSQEVEMGGYSDFNMLSPDSGEACAGVCHAQGTNEGLPAQWLIYITVDNLDLSADRCRELGGEVLVEPKSMGRYGRFCVIKDPAGAVAALFEPADLPA